MPGSQPNGNARESGPLLGVDSQRSLLIGAIAGVIVGLLFGLFAAWVVWPVTYSNAWPSDLASEAKAEYLSAVADAYVTSRSQQALSLAKRRLRLWEDSTLLTDEITAARNWYEETQPDEWGVRASNLNELADALEPSDPASGMLAAGGSTVTEQADPLASGPETGGTARTEEPVAAANLDVTPVADIGEPVDTGLSWFRWLFAVLAALILIGGGLYVLRLLYASSVRTQGATGSDRDEEWDGAADAIDDAYAEVDRELEEHARQSAYRRHSGTTDDDDDDEGYAFAAEDDDDIRSANTSTIPIDDDGPDGTQGDAERSGYDSDSPHDDEDDDHAHDGQPDDQAQTVPPDAPVQTAAETAVAASYTTRATPTVAPTSPVAGRELETFVAHYQYGVPDYDESFNVREREHGNYIGECGMGVNIKNGILQNNPENVVALDVWLFDKVSERQLETKTTVLISEEIVGSEWEKVFARGAEDDKPVVAQPGRQFRLEGSHLWLDCVVEKVVTSDEEGASGVFREVLVKMTVNRRR